MSDTDTTPPEPIVVDLEDLFAVSYANRGRPVRTKAEVLMFGRTWRLKPVNALQALSMETSTDTPEKMRAMFVSLFVDPDEGNEFYDILESLDEVTGDQLDKLLEGMTTAVTEGRPTEQSGPSKASSQTRATSSSSTGSSSSRRAARKR